MLDFKVLVKRLKGKDEGKIVWFYNILTGGGVIYQDWKMLTPVKNPLSPPLMFTGYKDNQSKDIYEGDVVEIDFTPIATQDYKAKAKVVRNENGCFVLELVETPKTIPKFVNRDMLLLTDDRLLLKDALEKYKIVVKGNIYEEKTK